MRIPDYSVPVEFTSASPASLDVDILILPICENEPPSPEFALPGAAARRLAESISRKEFNGKPCSLAVTPVDDEAWRPRRVMLAGLGPRGSAGTDQLRRAATAAGIAAREQKQRRVGMVLPGVRPAAEETQALIEGLLLSAFHAGSYKTDPDARPSSFDGFVLCGATGTSDLGLIRPAIQRGSILGSCSNLARALANEPGNAMTPGTFADVAGDIGREAGLSVEVIGESRIEALRMGLLLGVARGSAERPCVVVLKYEPQNPRPGMRLGLVGKGVTFDAGGISLKPADGMHKMKNDMSGGAAVVAAMKAIAALQPQLSVVGVIPVVENMPGGRALKPGDVLRSAAGKTVEVLNTDAEGRLILADALWYARELGATHLVDVATLTGAIGVALGNSTSGLFSTPDWWTDLVRRVAAQAGDRVWPMPLFDDYREQLQSDIADLANVGGRPAGSITAGVFLKEFTGGLPWAHLDIASTAWADESKPYLPKGPTGVAVRTLAALAETAGEWPTA